MPISSTSTPVVSHLLTYTAPHSPALFSRVHLIMQVGAPEPYFGGTSHHRIR